MKKFALFLLVAMLFTLGNAPMDRKVTEVTLNASQVTSAVDIEHAIDIATDNGTRPGIVTLDSSAGEFVYTADDRSINIYHSNITLRSKNGAVIKNCGDGIFFDDFVTDNIVIEGIRFIGENGVIAAYGTHRNVTIRNNVIIANSFAIGATKADGWNITGNHALAGSTVINLVEATETRVVNNSLVNTAQGLGIFLDKSNANLVSQNMIVNGWQGILIGWGASGNRVVDNRIHLIQQSGISFEGNNEYNSVLANKVSCQPNVECRIVNMDVTTLSPTNKIQGNKFMH